MLSTHPTSEGWVRYRRCICGEVSIELVRLGAHTTTVDPVATTSGHTGPQQAGQEHSAPGALPAQSAISTRV
ncbi:hypothetical protein TOK_2136 [Pseudonocardia sp. N23]|nr:hypothetical protein TOK_2136 [Pseudonocardia sp. N23]